MVCAEKETWRKAKSAEESALYYEFGSWLRTRRTNYGLIRLKKLPV
jgi:hypothetical protein